MRTNDPTSDKKAAKGRKVQIVGLAPHCPYVCQLTAWKQDGRPYEAALEATVIGLSYERLRLQALILTQSEIIQRDPPPPKEPE